MEIPTAKSIIIVDLEKMFILPNLNLSLNITTGDMFLSKLRRETP